MHRVDALAGCYQGRHGRAPRKQTNVDEATCPGQQRASFCGVPPRVGCRSERGSRSVYPAFLVRRVCRGSVRVQVVLGAHAGVTTWSAAVTIYRQYGLVKVRPARRLPRACGGASPPAPPPFSPTCVSAACVGVKLARLVWYSQNTERRAKRSSDRSSSPAHLRGRLGSEVASALHGDASHLFSSSRSRAERRPSAGQQAFSGRGIREGRLSLLRRRSAYMGVIVE